jgi:hypothetical protein
MKIRIKNVIILSLLFTATSLLVLWLGSSEEGEIKVAIPPDRAVQGDTGSPNPSPTIETLEQDTRVVETGDLQYMEMPTSSTQDIGAFQPTDASSHMALGMRYYRDNDLQKALWHLQEALRMEPENIEARQLLSRVSREVKVEEGFTSKEGSHFTVRYEGGENDVAGHLISMILEEAYHKVGSDMGFYPEDSITAVLYTFEQFRDVTRAPSWSGAIYDGKIRIPVGGVMERTDLLEKVIFHEYTHAVVHRMGGGRVPTWLNEGIAQYEEGRLSESEDILRYLASAKNPVPLSYLEGSFMGLSQEKAMIAYAEGLSVVKYIIEEYGMGMLGRLISSYKEKGSEEAMKETFHMTYMEFQDSWIRNLRKRYNY